MKIHFRDCEPNRMKKQLTFHQGKNKYINKKLTHLINEVINTLNELKNIKVKII